MIKKNAHSLWLVVFSLLITLTRCTGGNIITTFSGWGSNTNPTPDYANPLNAYRGGSFYHRHTVPGNIGINTVGDVRGESCSHAVLFLFAFGDSGIESAKKSAGITKVSSVEYEQMAISTNLYHRFCTIVLGNKESFQATPVVPAVVPKVEPAKLPAKKGK